MTSRRAGIIRALGAFVAGAVVVGVVWGIVAASTAGSSAPAKTRTPNGEVTTPIVDPPTASGTTSPSTVPAAAVKCPKATVRVSTASALTSALAKAKAGAVISLAPGRYVGNFVASRSGTKKHPVTLCGSAKSILDGGKIKKGYVVHLDHADYWRLLGFAVTNGQKGVVADGTNGSLIQGLAVYAIGDEGIHLRDFSSHNRVTKNSISHTGQLKEKFGEGIYIGTAKSNWCTNSGCKPDASNYNVISFNTVSHTTAENVDIKEGTRFGTLTGNSFDGADITAADSWVDVKGDGWHITDNTGKNSPNDGYQTHEIVDGMGTDNVFSGNTADVNGPGFGYSLTPVLGNVVTCSNKASNAGQGLSNVPCSG